MSPFITDIPLNQIRVLDRKTGNLLKYENATLIYLYYVNQGPVIFRTIIKKDPEDKYKLYMQQLPSSFDILKPLNSDMDELKRTLQVIADRVTKMEELIFRKLRLT